MIDNNQLSDIHNTLNSKKLTGIHHYIHTFIIQQHNIMSDCLIQWLVKEWMQHYVKDKHYSI